MYSLTRFFSPYRGLTKDLRESQRLISNSSSKINKNKDKTIKIKDLSLAERAAEAEHSGEELREPMAEGFKIDRIKEEIITTTTTIMVISRIIIVGDSSLRADLKEVTLLVEISSSYSKIKRSNSNNTKLKMRTMTESPSQPPLECPTWASWRSPLRINCAHFRSRPSCPNWGHHHAPTSRRSRRLSIPNQLKVRTQRATKEKSRCRLMRVQLTMPVKVADCY